MFACFELRSDFLNALLLSFFPSKVKEYLLSCLWFFFPLLVCFFFVHYLLSHPTLKLYFVFQCNAKPRLAQFCLICVIRPKLYLLSSLTHIFRPAKFKPCILFSPRVNVDCERPKTGFDIPHGRDFRFLINTVGTGQLE